MSGEPEVLQTIAALAAQGHEGVQPRLNDDSDWAAAIRLTVVEDPSPDSRDAIARTVHRVDPGAVMI